MHKRFVNNCTIEFSIIPDGPILIQSGKEGADPTKPNMEFVETYYQGGRSIYLPGSSLKGAIRAHAERIVRTVGQDKSGSKQPWANNPLTDDYKYLPDNKSGNEGDKVYQLSSFTDQIFGNTSLASRFRIEDAYPVDKTQVKTEERNGVAIDRVFGSVISGGLFNYQVCTAGEFKTKIHLKNFTLAQLGLIGLVLRDLNDGWFGLGFAKSRGMGTVQVKLNKAVVQYPGCVLEQDKIKILGSNKKSWELNQLLGVKQFLSEDSNSYEFPSEEPENVDAVTEVMDLGLGVQLTFHEGKVKQLFIAGVKAWKKIVEGK